ncbi:MAG: glycosyltransferase [Candidatus Hydrogenedentes bacterium]|nr:glycosyltransferase [Candidatus Hydrogenedentota bacterium]
MPYVSVIMPAYNPGEYLGPAVDSILAQDFDDLELLIVDDGSTDGYVDLLAKSRFDSRLRVIRQPNSGKPAAMNRAMREAVGEWIVMQDADDIAHPERIERLVQAVKGEPDLGAVFSGYYLVVNHHSLAPLSEKKNRVACREDIEQFRMPSHDPTIMFRAAIGRELGFDEELRGTEGYDFILRLGERYPLCVIPDVLYGYRIHDDSITRSDPVKRHHLMIKTLSKACQRRGLVFENQFPILSISGRATIFADNGLHAHFMQSVLSLREKGNLLAAWKTALASIAFQPRHIRYYRPLAGAALPWWLIRRLRRQKQGRPKDSSSGRIRILVENPFERSDPERYQFFHQDETYDYRTVCTQSTGRSKVGRIWSILRNILAIRWAILLARPHMVFCGDPRTGLPTCLFARLTGVRVPMVIWNFNMQSLYGGMRYWVARWGLRAVDRVVVYSNHEKRCYAAHFGVEENKFYTMLLSGPYLDDIRYQSLLSEEKEDYVVSPGYSGRDFRFLAEVASRTPELRFVVLAYPDFIDATLPENVDVRHSMPELEFCRWIARARLCLLPIANTETANGQIAIVQAMSLRTLLVTNETNGTVDYLAPGVNCISFDKSDVDGTARKLRRLFGSIAEYDGLVMHAYEDARANMGIEATTASVHVLVSEFVESGGGTRMVQDAFTDQRRQ